MKKTRLWNHQVRQGVQCHNNVTGCLSEEDWLTLLRFTWISEYLGIPALTGKKWVNLPTSILSNHCDNGHPVSPDDFTGLSSSSFNSELLSEKVLSANSIHCLMPTWALSHFLYFKTSFLDISTTSQSAVSFCSSHFCSYANISLTHTM